MLKLRKVLLYDYIYVLLVFATIIIAVILNNINFISVYKLSEKNFNLKIYNYKIDGNKLNIILGKKEKIYGTYYFKTVKELNNFKKNIKFGDKLKINGELFVPKNNTIPNAFNYKNYLKTNNIFYILKINNFVKIESNKNILYFFKNKIYNNIEKNKLCKDYLYAFILGDSFYINDEVNDSYIKNGVTHLFALSGAQVILLATFFMFILNKLKVSEIKQYIIVFLICVFLCFLTCFAPSITRASLFFFLLGINKTYYFNIKTKNILYLTLVILGLFDYKILFTLGFQLSFIVTYFLVISLGEITGSFKSLIYSCIISFISSIPINIYNFNYLNIGSIFINFIFVPYVSYIVYPLSLITIVLPFLSKILFFFTNIMEKLSLFLNNIKIFIIVFPKINLLTLLFIYLLLIFYIKYKKKVILIFLLFFLIVIYNLPKFNKSYNFYFTDVNQGDSLLITTPKLKKTILIDTGGNVEYNVNEWQKKNKKYSLGKDTLVPFYRSLGIKKIDYMFLTHGDADHLKETNNILEYIDCNHIFINKGNINYLESKIKKAKKINFKYLNIDGIEVYSLNNEIYNNDENKNSMILLLKVLGYNILMMGDSCTINEEYIMKKYNLKNIFILKVGHHGSKTSSSEKFLNYIKPKFSVISVGEKNRFNHPDKNVLKLIEKYSDKTLMTSKNGTIIFRISKKRVTINDYKPYNYSDRPCGV